MAEKQPKKKETVKEKRLSEEVVDQMTKLATSGFGLVAALAWNDAIQSFFNNYFGKFPQNTIYYKFFYAILITLLIVLVTYYLSKLASKIHQKDELSDKS